MEREVGAGGDFKAKRTASAQGLDRSTEGRTGLTYLMGPAPVLEGGGVKHEAPCIEASFFFFIFSVKNRCLTAVFILYVYVYDMSMMKLIGSFKALAQRI